MEIEPIPVSVAKMAQIPFDMGHKIPHPWFKKLRFPSGLVNLTAVVVLAEICWWYTPVPVKDEETGYKGLHKRFKGDLLRKSYDSFSELGLTKRQSIEACKFLKNKGLITLELRTVTIENVKQNNVLFIGINPRLIWELSIDSDTPLRHSDVVGTTIERTPLRHSDVVGADLRPVSINIIEGSKELGVGEKQNTETVFSKKEEQGKSKQGKRIDPNWALTESLRSYALSCCPDMADAELSEIEADFKDFWVSLPTQKALKLDWDATWRRWIRTYVRRDRPKTVYAKKEKQETNAEKRARESREYRQRLSSTPGVDPFANGIVSSATGNGKV